jgi:serine/threonine-protein kinase
VVEVGSVLGGKYRVGRPLGSGAMGVIVEAMHLQLGTNVAVKVLRKSYAEKADVAERFLREARAAAQLRNEHICRVHDYGTLDDGTPFMVMELLEGRDLGTLVDYEGPLPAELVAHCIVQTCEGIAEPHARGMVHRDLKPTNLYLERKADGSPFIKILDFGIAKFESVDFKLTETTSVVGSPAYMAPEQLRSAKNVDTRTDIWALGVVMYELLTEKQPFTGESMTDLALCISTEPPLPLPETVAPELAAIVMRCLEKDPAKRFQDVAALAETLAPFAKLDASHAAAAARMLSKPRDALAVVDELLAKQTKHTTLHGATGSVVIPRSVPKATLGLAAALVVAVGVIAFLYLRRGDEPVRHDEPAAATTAPPAPDAARPIDAAAIPAVVPVDAAEPDAAVDAAAPPPDAAVEPPVKIKKKTVKHTTHGTPDLTKSRF